MNKTLIGVAALGAILLAGGAWAADDADSRCREYAKEDGVATGEMEDYMAQCLEEQRLADTGADMDSADDKSNSESISND